MKNLMKAGMSGGLIVKVKSMVFLEKSQSSIIPAMIVRE